MQLRYYRGEQYCLNQHLLWMELKLHLHQSLIRIESTVQRMILLQLRYNMAFPPGSLKLYLYLPVQNEMVHVGILSQEGKEFVFRYDERFQHREDVPPISAFPDKTKEYRSEMLWPFFEVRLPPLDRPDIASQVKDRNVDQDDVLTLLAEFGQKTVTTPYEFKMEMLTHRS